MVLPVGSQMGMTWVALKAECRSSQRAARTHCSAARLVGHHWCMPGTFALPFLGQWMAVCHAAQQHALLIEEQRFISAERKLCMLLCQQEPRRVRQMHDTIVSAVVLTASKYLWSWMPCLLTGST